MEVLGRVILMSIVHIADTSTPLWSVKLAAVCVFTILFGVIACYCMYIWETGKPPHVGALPTGKIVLPAAQACFPQVYHAYPFWVYLLYREGEDYAEIWEKPFLLPKGSTIQCTCGCPAAPRCFFDLLEVRGLWHFLLLRIMNCEYLL